MGSCSTKPAHVPRRPSSASVAPSDRFSSKVAEHELDDWFIVTVDKPLSQVIQSSWLAMMNKRSKLGHTSVSGTKVFILEFFIRLAAVDPEGIVNKMFVCHTRKEWKAEDCFINLVKIFINVSDETWPTKRRLRTLARYYARLGVREKQFQIFRDVLLQTVEVLVNDLDMEMPSTYVVAAWTSLLQFIVTEMTSERVVFYPRVHTKEYEQVSQSFSMTSFQDLCPCQHTEDSSLARTYSDNTIPETPHSLHDSTLVNCVME